MAEAAQELRGSSNALVELACWVGSMHTALASRARSPGSLRLKILSKLDAAIAGWITPDILLQQAGDAEKRCRNCCWTPGDRVSVGSTSSEYPATPLLARMLLVQQ